MMDFFEAVRRGAFKPYQFDEGYTVFERAAILGVVDATIEALKEMAVGEPIVDKLEVHKGYTGIDYGSSGWLCELWRYDDDLATDGEEVVVMVFKVEEKE